MERHRLGDPGGRRGFMEQAAELPGRDRSIEPAPREQPALAAEPKHLGARIGFTAVLHTWGSALPKSPKVTLYTRGFSHFVTSDPPFWPFVSTDLRVAARRYRHPMIELAAIRGKTLGDLRSNRLSIQSKALFAPVLTHYIPFPRVNIRSRL